MKRLLILVSILISMIPSTVRAIDDPDSLLITRVAAFTDALEPNDFLVVAGYVIRYSTIPTEPASDTFLARFRDSGDNVLQTSVPYPFQERGYNEGVISFYFTPEEVTALGLGYPGDYSVVLQGNPSFFPTPPIVTTSSVVFFSEFSTPFNLKAEVIAYAISLETTWTDQDLQSGGILSNTGEDYFGQAIPNLRLMIPSLFTGSLRNPDYAEQEFDHPQDLVTARAEFWEGTIIEGFINGVAMALNSENNEVIKDFIKLFCWYGFVAFVSVIYLRTPGAKFEFVMIIFFVATPYGAYIDLVHPIAAGIVAFILAAAGLYVFTLRQGSG